MKKTLLIFGSLLMTVTLLSCSGNSEEGVENNGEITPPQEEVVAPVNGEEDMADETIAKDVKAEEFKALIESGEGQVLDVRTAGEFEAGHIEGAINIDFYADDFESQIEALDKNVTYYVYCQSGGRSGQTKNMMAEKGFVEVYNLIGGYGGWPYK